MTVPTSLIETTAAQCLRNDQSSKENEPGHQAVIPVGHAMIPTFNRLQEIDPHSTGCVTQRFSRPRRCAPNYWCIYAWTHSISNRQILLDVVLRLGPTA